MRRNRTEVKGDPPRLLAGKREKPAEAEEEKPAPCEDFLCKLLREIITWGIIMAFVLAVAWAMHRSRPFKPADGQSTPAEQPLGVSMPIGVAPIPTAADYSVAFKLLRDRFDQLKADVHQESLDLLGTELDQLEKEMAFVARVEADLQQTFGQVRQKLREIARV